MRTMIADLPWILLSISVILNVIEIILYVRLFKQKRSLSTFKVDMLDTIFYRDLTKQNNKQ